MGENYDIFYTEPKEEEKKYETLHDPLAPVTYKRLTFRADQVWGGNKVAREYERTITAIHDTRTGHIVFYVEGENVKKSCTIGDFFQWTVAWGASVQSYDQWEIRQKRENEGG